MTGTYQYMPRAAPVPGVEYPLTVKYCGGEFCLFCCQLSLNVQECTMPVEYCEFSPAPEKCREWLEKNLPEEFDQLRTGEDGIASGVDAPTKGRQVRGGKGTSRKPVKQKINVFKTSRGKKKFTTSVIGLSTFGIDLKAASKVFGQKFATGSSVTGNGDEIVIQGDVKDEIIDILTEKWPEIDEDLIEDLGEMKR
ncbi:Density-regulated protein [Paragonimus heterotremus]|uniref:Density-regulated protein n=1 Tax=Paragonimus heterotremus TaxID=100268 RepID=A0A8J4WPC2_9TREM|nr:Density-regulated protein [Paragonimus heterotremus]